jgi:hypothetical protein
MSALVLQYTSANSGHGPASHEAGAAVGVFDEADQTVRSLIGWASLYEVATEAVRQDTPLETLIAGARKGPAESYPELLRTGRLRPPIGHPEPARCWVVSTGLTHLDSVLTRNAMAGGDETRESDSLRMFKAGVAGGKPAAGEVGAQPEWCFKGNGTTLITSGEAIATPDFAFDTGEEPELACVYLIDPAGQPRRLGFTFTNDFSDHVLEGRNYLYVAASKLRPCGIAPALRVGPLPGSVAGVSRIVRGDRVVWERSFLTGPDHMCHSVENLEHHHFKHQVFRRPGDVHIYLFGTPVFSFRDGIERRVGDDFCINVTGFGPPLVNRLAVEPPRPWRVTSL